MEPRGCVMLEDAPWDRQMIGLTVAVRESARACRWIAFTEPMAKTTREGRGNREERVSGQRTEVAVGFWLALPGLIWG